jgi:hypothetical protein
MTDTILSKTFEISANDLKRMYRERREFEHDRSYRGGRVKYMTHADGYVMARKPRAMPFVISEKEWRQLPLLG